MFSSVIVRRKFTAAEEWAMERCARWNFTQTLPKIAKDLIENGPEWGTIQWNEVGGVFVKYFGNRDSLCCSAKRDWEIIGDMVREFGDSYVNYTKKEVRDGEVEKG
jgi:hypothetical protein